MAAIPWNRQWNLATRILNEFSLADFRPVSPSIPSPDGKKYIVPMSNTCYADKYCGRLVTFDVRENNGEVLHHIQSDIGATERWAIGWRGNNTVVVKGSRTGIRAYDVGVDSMHRLAMIPLPPRVFASRRWTCQFSLGTLLIATTIISVLLGCVMWSLRS
jgi:hypothetical protein